jgi:hypothetical protein
MNSSMKKDSTLIRGKSFLWECFQWELQRAFKMRIFCGFMTRFCSLEILIKILMRYFQLFQRLFHYLMWKTVWNTPIIILTSEESLQSFINSFAYLISHIFPLKIKRTIFEIQIFLNHFSAFWIEMMKQNLFYVKYI